MSKALVRINEKSKQKLEALVKYNNDVISSELQPKINQELYLNLLIEGAFDKNKEAMKVRGII